MALILSGVAVLQYGSRGSLFTLILRARRIKATKWPEREIVSDASQGVQLATTQKVARYWQTDYDWRKSETVIFPVDLQKKACY